MRVMAIDYGDARTGVALSDPSGLLTGFTTVIHSRNRETVLAQLAALCKERGADRLVMGFPRNMDGTEGERAALSREFAELLRAETGLEVVLWDERRSSIEAHAILHANGRKEKDHRKNVDAVAASLMLEGYLGSL